jgi:serine/threonine protein kinase
MKLNHPNVVRSFQVGEADGLHYLVMEHLDGVALDEVMQKRGRFPPAEAARIVYLALLGLQHIHEQRLVHRDLNPANLMLFPPPNQGDTTKSNVKILEIGLGREIFRDEASVKRDNGRITIAGAILGTPEYMSPEQARDARSADIRSDIYSLGCVLYRLIAGQPVFQDTNVISQMIRHASEEPQPLKEFNPVVPEGLQQVVSTMLAKDPAKRYATPDRAAEALRACLQAGASPSERPEPSLEMRNYLTWLETEDKKADKAAGGPTAPLIAAFGEQPKAGPTAAESQAMTEARTAAKAAARATARKMIEAKRRGKKKLPKTRVQLPAPLAAPVNPAPANVVLPDVQLVPVAPTPASSPFRITWRDFLMFTIGVIGSLAAIALAYLLAKLVT